MAVSFNGKHLAKFIRPEEYEAIYPQVELAHNQLESKTGAGSDFLGWLGTCRWTYDKEEFARIKEAAAEDPAPIPRRARSSPESAAAYLGARAAVEAAQGNAVPQRRCTTEHRQIYFCGRHHQPRGYLHERASMPDEGQALSPINVISKSGTTTETAHRVPRAAQGPAGGYSTAPTEANRPHLRHDGHGAQRHAESSWQPQQGWPKPSSCPTTSAAATPS